MTPMFRRLAALLLLALLAAPASAQSPADRAAIERVIRDQMAAFLADDAGAAFAFAAPSIQAMFGTPENFLAMVRSGYAPVYRPRAVEFAELGLSHGVLVQRVLVTGPDGMPEVAHYMMERQPDGRWRIAGCVLTRSEDRTT
ncbi:DUF4864 domain-containing protein [Stella sp.]|uniref:DUF4864 domain-containing protein n=1 Tax=Stella sp. TaxID=2912054 RepID=UPI0035AFB92B